MRSVLLSLVALAGTLLAAQQTTKPPIIRDEAALHEWATPIARLNVRPGHFSSAEYHKAPVGMKLNDADRGALLAFLRSL